MKRQFDFATEFIPYFGIGLGRERSSRHDGIIVLLPFVSFTLTMKLKDPDAL